MAWKLAREFRVIGTPRPGGSKTAFYNKKAGRAMIVDACKTSKTWRQDVVAYALPVKPAALLDGCLKLEVIFYLPRPKGHYRTGKNAHLLKDDAPPFPNTMPDTTKLLRSTEDALTKILWLDDARITDQNARKRYCLPGQAPGASIEVYVWQADADVPLTHKES